MTQHRIIELLRTLLGGLLMAAGFIGLLWSVELAFVQ